MDGKSYKFRAKYRGKAYKAKSSPYRISSAFMDFLCRSVLGIVKDGERLISWADSIQMPVRLWEITSVGLTTCCQFPSKLERAKLMTIHNLCPINKKIQPERSER